MPSPSPARLAAPLVAAGLALAGCGASGPSGAAAFPLELRETGGLAGLDNRVTVRADGQVTGSARPPGGSGRERVPMLCRVDAAFLEKLADAASEDLRPGATSPVPQHIADGINLMVSGPGGAAYDVGEGGSEVTRLAGELIHDAMRPPGERTVCR